MDSEQRARVLKLRIASKSGKETSKRDLRFITKMAADFPKEYAELDGIVWEATKPFGSTRTWKN